MVSHHCVFFGESSVPQTEKKPGEIGDMDTVSLQCEFSCESSNIVPGRRTLYTWSRNKVSHHCVFSFDFSGSQTQRNPFDTRAGIRFLSCVNSHMNSQAC